MCLAKAKTGVNTHEGTLKYYKLQISNFDVQNAEKVRVGQPARMIKPRSFITTIVKV